jgi:uncharacterized protein DUF2809
MLNAASDLRTRNRAVSPALIVRAGLCVLTITSGLALRGLGLGLGVPSFFVKYGGSLLWGAMVFFLAAMAVPRPRWAIVLISAAIAAGVELFRLVHAPWLDGFRMTLAGALLLGRIFSAWNLLAYGAGIVLAGLLDGWAIRAFATATRDAGTEG